MSLQVRPPSPAGWPRLAHRTERASPRAQALLKSLIMLHLPLSHQPKQISVQTQTQSRTSPTSSWKEMQRIFIHFWQSTADIKNERVASFFYYNGYRVMQNVYFLQTMSNYIFFFCILLFFLPKHVWIIFWEESKKPCGMPHCKDAGDSLFSSGELPQIVQTVRCTVQEMLFTQYSW